MLSIINKDLTSMVLVQNYLSVATDLLHGWQMDTDN